ncbi:MAG TPA: DUF2093 domain-containing protein [Hellea balneolensis]|uniref:DUF2093 domain-containing protein n=1 Tax=Hellea balneolensis TaxID=287478 RepID=A0A7C5R7W9_9PROT|nr:DUF2093 domain-containing protein [Hellea balneolensis]
MLNFTNSNVEAKISYGSSDYVILEPGSFVRCAVTGEKITLDNLKYWNDDLQEAYIDASASLKRFLEVRS